MADLERTDGSGDEFVAEVSDLGPGDEAIPGERLAPFLEPTRLAPRQRLIRLATIVVAPLLVLLIVLAANPALGVGLGDIITGLVPTPAPQAPANDLFYLLPNPPGVDVTLDGHVLTRQPFPGDSQPLKLAPGRHMFAWRSRTLPFRPLQCQVTVPRLVAGDCPMVEPLLLPFQFANRPGAVIAMHESRSALTQSSDADQLDTAIQTALDAIESTAIVRPGEPYMASGADRVPTIAQQPLRAIRQYQYVHQTGYPEPCIQAQPIIPCRFPGQDCNDICTAYQPPASITGADGAWIAAAVVSTTWIYFTQHGDVSVAEALGLQLATFRITHDTGRWQVSVIVGHTPGFDAADDIACDPARYALAQTSSWSFIVTNPPPGAQVNYVSDGTPADGCVIEIEYGGPALFLQRFGVLITVNEAARSSVDNLPVADSTERALAQRLLNPPHWIIAQP